MQIKLKHYTEIILKKLYGMNCHPFFYIILPTIRKSHEEKTGYSATLTQIGRFFKDRGRLHICTQGRPFEHFRWLIRYDRIFPSDLVWPWMSSSDKSLNSSRYALRQHNDEPNDFDLRNSEITKEQWKTARSFNDFVNNFAKLSRHLITC